MKKIASILLAIFFLVSTSHLSFATHICGGHAVKHTLLIGASDFGCGMEDEITHQESDECNVQNECCENELIILTIQDNFQPSLTKINTEQSFILANVATILFATPIIDKEIALYKDYQPPIPEKDIPVLFQSFLI